MWGERWGWNREVGGGEGGGGEELGEGKSR